MKALTLFLLLASIPVVHADEVINDIITCERQEETPVLSEEAIELSGQIVDVSTEVIKEEAADTEVKSEAEVQVVSDLAKETTELLEEVAVQKENQVQQPEEKKEVAIKTESRASSLLTATTNFFKRQYEVAKPQLQKAYSYTTSKLKQLGGFLFDKMKKQKKKADDYLDKKEEEKKQMLKERANAYQQFNLQNSQLNFNDKTYQSKLIKSMEELKTTPASKEAQYVIHEHRIAYVDQQSDELVWLDSLKLKALYKKDIVVANLRIAAVKDLNKKAELKKEYEELNKHYEEISNHLNQNAYSPEDLIGLHRLNSAATDFTSKISDLNALERKVAREQKEKEREQQKEEKAQAEIKEEKVVQQTQTGQQEAGSAKTTTIPHKNGQISFTESQQKVSVKGDNYDVYEVEF